MSKNTLVLSFMLASLNILINDLYRSLPSGGVSSGPGWDSIFWVILHGWEPWPSHDFRFSFEYYQKFKESP